MENYTDQNYGYILQNHGVLPAPIKKVVVEHQSSDLYKAFLVLENGIKIWCNYGCIGKRCLGASGNSVKEVEEGWAKELEKFWFSRNFAVMQ